MLALVLHAHQPYVRHPERTHVDEESWFSQAFVESYLPMLELLQGLAEAEVPFRLSVSLSPTLLEMLRDPLVKERFRDYLERMLELGDQELARTRGGNFEEMARATRDRFQRAHGFLEAGRDFLEEMQRLHRSAHIELLTGPATHAYLPLLGASSIRAQLLTARTACAEHLELEPRGLWLPQLGYSEELEAAIASAGFAYFLVDAPGLIRAHPRPRYATFRPVRSPSGAVCLARDLEATREVLAPAGYPGDPLYRDFFRDIGWDLDPAYLTPFVPFPGRRYTGYKYYRITGPTDRKEPYSLTAGAARAREHAEQFVASRGRQLRWLNGQMDRDPVLVFACDLEFLGHRWFEGPGWLEAVLRGLHQAGIPTLRLSDAIEQAGTLQCCRPSASSGLGGGTSRAMVGESNQWIYRHLHRAGRDLHELVTTLADPAPLEVRALRQAGRELLLAEASDWAVMLSWEVYPDYARQRVTEHILEFRRLHGELVRRRVQEAPLQRAEKRNPLFSGLDPRAWKEPDEPA